MARAWRNERKKENRNRVGFRNAGLDAQACVISYESPPSFAGPQRRFSIQMDLQTQMTELLVGQSVAATSPRDSPPSFQRTVSASCVCYLLGNIAFWFLFRNGNPFVGATSLLFPFSSVFHRRRENKRPLELSSMPSTSWRSHFLPSCSVAELQDIADGLTGFTLPTEPANEVYPGVLLGDA